MDEYASQRPCVRSDAIQVMKVLLKDANVKDTNIEDVLERIDSIKSDAWLDFMHNRKKHFEEGRSQKSVPCVNQHLQSTDADACPSFDNFIPSLLSEGNANTSRQFPGSPSSSAAQSAACNLVDTHISVPILSCFQGAMDAIEAALPGATSSSSESQSAGGSKRHSRRETNRGSSPTICDRGLLDSASDDSTSMRSTIKSDLSRKKVLVQKAVLKMWSRDRIEAPGHDLLNRILNDSAHPRRKELDNLLAMLDIPDPKEEPSDLYNLVDFVAHRLTR